MTLKTTIILRNEGNNEYNGRNRYLSPQLYQEEGGNMSIMIAKNVQESYQEGVARMNLMIVNDT